MSQPVDWSKYKHLSKETKKNIAPINDQEYNKAKHIQNLYKLQDGIAKKDPKLASVIEKEVRFIRYSK